MWCTAISNAICRYKSVGNLYLVFYDLWLWNSNDCCGNAWQFSMKRWFIFSISANGKLHLLWFGEFFIILQITVIKPWWNLLSIIAKKLKNSFVEILLKCDRQWFSFWIDSNRRKMVPVYHFSQFFSHKCIILKLKHFNPPPPLYTHTY